MTKRIPFIFLFLIIFSSGIFAQKVYCLEELLRMSDSESSAHQIDSLNIVAASSDRLRARSAYFPKISLTTDWVSLRTPIKIFDVDRFAEDLLGNYATILETNPGLKIKESLQDAMTFDLKNTWFFNAGLVQPIFSGGQILASNQIADLALEATQVQIIRARAERHHAVKEAYYTLINIVEKESVVERFVTMLEEIYSDVEALYREGYATKADILDARLALSKARNALSDLQKAHPLATQALAILVNLPQETNFLPEESLEELAKKGDCLLETLSDTTEASNSTAQSPDTLHSSREKLSALNTEILSRQQVIEQSKMLPRLGFFANYTAFYPNFLKGFDKQVGGTWSFGFSLQVPVSDIYSGYQARKSAKAKVLIASLQEQEIAKKLRLERDKTLQELRIAKSNYTSARSQLKDIQESLDLATKAYKEGEIDMVRLLNTKELWLEVNNDYIDALTDLFKKEAAYRLSRQ